MQQIETRTQTSSYHSMEIREIRIQFTDESRPYAIAKVCFFLADGTTDKNSFMGCELTAGDLSTWGDDDSVVATIIADKLGIALVN